MITFAEFALLMYFIKFSRSSKLENNKSKIHMYMKFLRGFVGWYQSGIVFVDLFEISSKRVGNTGQRAEAGAASPPPVPPRHDVPHCR